MKLLMATEFHAHVQLLLFTRIFRSESLRYDLICMLAERLVCSQQRDKDDIVVNETSKSSSCNHGEGG
jgi:hypothetical protein